MAKLQHKTLVELTRTAHVRRAHVVSITLKDGENETRQSEHVDEFHTWLIERGIPYVRPYTDNIIFAAMIGKEYDKAKKLPYVHHAMW